MPYHPLHCCPARRCQNVGACRHFVKLHRLQVVVQFGGVSRWLARNVRASQRLRQTCTTIPASPHRLSRPIRIGQLWGRLLRHPTQQRAQLRGSPGVMRPEQASEPPRSHWDCLPESHPLTWRQHRGAGRLPRLTGTPSSSSRLQARFQGILVSSRRQKRPLRVPPPLSHICQGPSFFGSQWHARTTHITRKCDREQRKSPCSPSRQ